MTVPSYTHLFIVALIQSGKAKFVISQNVDGLHLRSGVKRSELAELHGNVFLDKC